MSGERNAEALLHSIFNLLPEEDRLDMVEMCEAIIADREKSPAPSDHDDRQKVQHVPKRPRPL